MAKKRIKELANFFYSSDCVEDVPLRICCSTGRYSGLDLGSKEFVSLFSILAKSKDLKRDLKTFVEAMYAE